MTLHSQADYKCEKCGLHYIPFPPVTTCPYCHAQAKKVFKTFIDEFLVSAAYNIHRYRHALPFAWAELTTGDEIFLRGFAFLELLRIKLQLRHAHEMFEKGVPCEVCIDLIEQLTNEVAPKIRSEEGHARLRYLKIFLKEVCKRLRGDEKPIRYLEKAREIYARVQASTT